MRIQQRIFHLILLVFTLVFSLSTWVYYVHFSETLRAAEAKQASQINRYIHQEISDVILNHKTLMNNLNKDGDIVSAYDDVAWVAFMGRKFVKKNFKNIFKNYPYLREITLIKGDRNFIHEQSNLSNDLAQSWFRQDKALDVKSGKLIFKIGFLKLLQQHLIDNKVHPSIKVFYTIDNKSWIVAQNDIQKAPTQLNISDEDQTITLSAPYLISPKLGNVEWSIRSLIPQKTTQNALRELLINALITYLISAILLFIIAKKLSYLVIRPLHRLEKAAITIMEGDYIPVHTETVDETQPAINAFNLMAQRIQDFTNELQEQVFKRTHELEIANAELAAMNETDALTKAHNRQFLNHQIPLLLKIAKRNKLSLCVAMLDIDLFKDVNDTYGHIAGDECLVAFVEKMNATFKRDNDWIIRYGGEEFCLICFGEQKEKFAKQLEHFRNNIEQMAISTTENHKIKFTVSIGYTYFEQAPEYWSETIISDADTMMYKAKTSGRNRIIG